MMRQWRMQGSLHPSKIVELLAAWAAFLMHGELAILCKRHMHNYGLAVYSVCGHACSSHWSHTSPLHDRTKTANGSCSSENPPRNSGMRPGLTVRRSTSDSTLSRPTVAFFSPPSKQKVAPYKYINIYNIYSMLCSSACITPLLFFVVFYGASTGQRGRLCATALGSAAACCLPAADHALRAPLLRQAQFAPLSFNSFTWNVVIGQACFRLDA